MSRSRHNKSGKVSPPHSYYFELQGKRPREWGGYGGQYGARWTKTHTHRLERRAGKQETRGDS